MLTFRIKIRKQLAATKYYIVRAMQYLKKV